jgi:hypothetical protein
VSIQTHDPEVQYGPEAQDGAEVEGKYEEPAVDADQLGDELGKEQDWADEEPTSTHALFDGDEGGLELDQRRAMVVLLKNRFITPESHPREWRAIIAPGRLIEQRMNDLFLELVVNLEREVAYKRPITSDTGGRDFPTLLHDTAWQREETALLVFLRVRARTEQSRGEAHARVAEAELQEYLEENRPASATNRVADSGRTKRAIGTLKTAGLLVKTDEDGVFRISPAIESMLPATTLNDLLGWLTVRTGTDSEFEFESESGLSPESNNVTAPSSQESE